MLLESPSFPKNGKSLARIAVTFFCMFFPFVVWAVDRPGDAVSNFENANKAYEQGRYAEAVQSYDRILATGRKSVALLFNLGNAYFQNRQPGFAIAAYLRAQQLAPRDPDVRANLDLVRAKVGGTRNDGAVHQLVSRLTLDEWAAVWTVASWIWFSLLTARVLSAGRGVPKWMLSVAGCIWTGILAILLWINARQHTSEKGVIIVAEAAVRRGPLAESQTAFSLRDGTEVRVVEERDEWRRIEDSENRSGWVQSDRLVIIRN